MRQVENPLIIGVGMNRGHRAVLDSEILVHNFGYRGQAVRGAGSIRDYIVPGRVVLAVVYAEHDGNVFVFSRG